jgi:hypothetical protein
MIGQCQRSLLAAAPRRTIGTRAILPALGRVNAVQSDPLAMNLDCVAVDDRSCSHKGRFT